MIKEVVIKLTALHDGDMLEEPQAELLVFIELEDGSLNELEATKLGIGERIRVRYEPSLIEKLKRR
jgi:hypothetical protein